MRRGLLAGASLLFLSGTILLSLSSHITITQSHVDNILSSGTSANLATTTPHTQTQKKQLPTTDNPSSIFQKSVDYLKQIDAEMGDRSCSAEFGLDMLNKFHETLVDVCAGSREDSQMTCHNRPEFQVPRMLCEAKHAHVRLFPPFHRPDSGDLTRGVNVGIQDSFYEVNCSPEMYRWVPSSQWVTSNSHFMINPNFVVGPLDCSAGTITHPIFFLERWDATNMFHFMEDVVTTYESLAVLGIDPAETELVVYDGFVANNALFELWGKMFGKGVRVVRHHGFYPANTCIERSAVNMHAGISHLSHKGLVGRNTHCSSPILKGLRMFLLSALGFDSSPNPPPPSTRRVVFISRRAMPGKAISRVIPNEDEILSHISANLPPNWKLDTFRPETISSFVEQVRVVATASVLVGVHGAALTYLTFMPMHAHVVEIFHSDRGPANRHYNNMCTMLGMTYHEAGHYSSTVSKERVWDQVQAAVRTIDGAFN